MKKKIEYDGVTSFTYKPYLTFPTTDASMPEEKKFLAGPQEDDVLRCVCPAVVDNEISVDEVKRKKRHLKWDNYSAESLNEVKLLAVKYQIFCYNGDEIQKVNPNYCDDKMIQLKDIPV